MKTHHIDTAISRTERLIALHEGVEDELLLFAPAPMMAVDVPARRRDIGGRADPRNLCPGDSALNGWRGPSFRCERPAGNVIAIAWSEYDLGSEPTAQARMISESRGYTARERLSSGESR